MFKCDHAWLSISVLDLRYTRPSRNMSAWISFIRLWPWTGWSWHGKWMNWWAQRSERSLMYCNCIYQAVVTIQKTVFIIHFWTWKVSLETIYLKMREQSHLNIYLNTVFISYVRKKISFDSLHSLLLDTSFLSKHSPDSQENEDPLLSDDIFHFFLYKRVCTFNDCAISHLNAK